MKTKKTGNWFQRRSRLSQIGIVLVLLVMGLILIGGRTLATWHVQPAVSSPDALEQSPWFPLPPGEATLRLATWNVWGLPALTPHRAERIQALAEAVAQSGADIACFQEVFLEADRRTLCDTLAGVGLAHWRYFSSAPGGSGLLTVSRYPIEEAAFMRFSRGGDPLAFKQGDWWAGKGAGLITVTVPGLGPVRIINSHLHARYSGDHYRELRQQQMAELLRLAETAGANGTPVLIAGDLNYRKDDPFWSGQIEARDLIELSRRWSPIDYVLAVGSTDFVFEHSEGEKLDGHLPDGETRFSDHVGILAVTTIRYHRPN